MSEERFLLTGSMGCIGSWVLRLLLDEGVPVVATDLDLTPTRPALLMNESELRDIQWQQLDVTDQNAVNKAVADNGITHIIHLAGLQIPFCRANPSLGAAVNVVGTVNVFEAARGNYVKGLSYASSLAALGPPEMYPDRPIKDDVRLEAETLYGVYKTCNEQTARVYWKEWEIGSIGLRPYNVYGVGRDQGLTSDVAKSILATAAGRDFTIRYNGPLALQHAKDVADAFIKCARKQFQGASICNMRNDVMSVEDFIEKLVGLYPEARVTCKDMALPYPADLDDSGLAGILGSVPHTPMETAIVEDMALYKSLIERDAIDLKQLDV